MDYKKTLLMPSTSFEMRGNLTQKDKVFLKKELDLELYKKQQSNSQKDFILHDGPPYANGSLHTGHALNKILKDFIIRGKSLRGFNVDWVFGWDTHGLPIENAVSKQDNWDPSLPIIEKTKKFRNYALKQQQNQLKQFKKLGLFTDFDKNYLTLTSDYVASELEVLFEMLNQGLISRALKPVYWSWSSKTALAEAEIEYKDVISDAIFVSFKLSNDLNALIWTTTPWTLMANVAIAFGKNIDYGIYKIDNQNFVIAKNMSVILESKFAKKLEFISDFDTEEFVGKDAINLLTNKTSKIVYGHHVTDENGSGIVHIAGGHGEDDYKITIENNLELFVVVNEIGNMINSDKYDGLFYQDAQVKIIDELKLLNALVYQEQIEHSYPHDWRSKKPIIYIATLQWFVSIDKIREDLIKQIDTVEWTPKWGKDRLTSMIENRGDWCISRQRNWGVPITIIVDENGNPIIDKNLQKVIIENISKNGESWWYQTSIEEILSLANLEYKDSYVKETDILDVWFDSGVSHYYMFKDKQIDMYLEGFDQFRGWFNSSLITSFITKQKAPYKEVVVHSFVTDGNGIKMSKSIGNVIDPLEVVDKFGIDILRLWVAKSDYKQSVKISDEILDQVAKDYKKIRNTFRFILGNIDSNLSNDVKDYSFNEIDKIVLSNLNHLNKNLEEYNNQYNFLQVIGNILSSISTGFISFYLDYAKDVLYTNSKNSIERKTIQFVIKQIFDVLAFTLYPIMPVTIDEAIYNFDEQIKSIYNYRFNLDFLKEFNLEEEANILFEIRNKVNSEIENLRQNKIISSSLEVSLELILPDKLNIFNQETFKKAFMVAKVSIESGNDLMVKVFKDESLIKCQRCWKYFDQSEIKEDICNKCHHTINEQ